MTPDDQELASSTLALVPDSVPVVREPIPFSGVTAAVAALGRVIYAAASAGRAMAIDPGRPGIPAFGRQIYHLNAFRKRSLPGPEQGAANSQRYSSVRSKMSVAWSPSTRSGSPSASVI